MKLRNKKTGEITYINIEFPIMSNNEVVGSYFVNSLAEVNAKWEDYKPAEPLIKDEKIRKAVRAWWKTIPDIITDKRVLYKKNQDLAVGVYTIYCGAIYPETLEVGKMYSIIELCGEEE